MITKKFVVSALLGSLLVVSAYDADDLNDGDVNELNEFSQKNSLDE